MTILNVYAPNGKAAKYLKEKPIELKRQIYKFTIIVKKFNAPLSVTNKTPTKEIGNGMEELNNTVNQQNPTRIYRTLHTRA